MKPGLVYMIILYIYIYIIRSIYSTLLVCILRRVL